MIDALCADLLCVKSCCVRENSISSGMFENDVMDINCEVAVVRLNGKNFNKYSLDGFAFDQTVTHCWRKIGDVYKLLPINYNEALDLNGRRRFAERIAGCINSGEAAFAALYKGEIAGIALLSGKLFGGANRYADLKEFYVSEPCRRRGIGKMLFDEVCQEAKNFGALKIYISAHSAEESIAAYSKYGCVLAEHPDEAHILKEPCDLQLEFKLGPRIYEVADKLNYLPLLLLADEQEEMIDRYLSGGIMYVIDDCGVKGEAVISDVGGGTLEIKNLAVLPQYRRCGYGKRLIDFICEKYGQSYSILQVGTGESPLTVPFYEKCGFTYSHRIENFFTDNYDHHIIEEGVLLKDMIYLRKKL